MKRVIGGDHLNTARISRGGRGGRGSRGGKTQRQPPFLPLLQELASTKKFLNRAVLGIISGKPKNNSDFVVASASRQP